MNSAFVRSALTRQLISAKGGPRGRGRGERRRGGKRATKERPTKGLELEGGAKALFAIGFYLGLFICS